MLVFGGVCQTRIVLSLAVFLSHFMSFCLSLNPWMKPVLTGTARLAQKLRKTKINHKFHPFNVNSWRVFRASQFTVHQSAASILYLMVTASLPRWALDATLDTNKHGTCPKMKVVQCSSKRVFSRNSQQGKSLVVVVWQFDICLGWWQFVLCSLSHLFFLFLLQIAWAAWVNSMLTLNAGWIQMNFMYLKNIYIYIYLYTHTPYYIYIYPIHYSMCKQTTVRIDKKGQQSPFWGPPKNTLAICHLVSKLTSASLRHKVAREKMQDWLAGTQKGMVWYGRLWPSNSLLCQCSLSKNENHEGYGKKRHFWEDRVVK